MQLWCGEWWDCNDPRCWTSALIESEALKKQNKELAESQGALL